MKAKRKRKDFGGALLDSFFCDVTIDESRIRSTMIKAFVLIRCEHKKSFCHCAETEKVSPHADAE